MIQAAQEDLQKGALTAAVHRLDQAAELDLSSEHAAEVRVELERARRHVQQARERAEAIRTALSRARAELQRNAFESAVQAANEVLAIDVAHPEALALREGALKAIAERNREAAAREIVAAARAQFADGHHADAIAALEAFRPPHASVTQALEALRFELEEIQRQDRLRRDTLIRAAAAEIGKARDVLAAGDTQAARLILSMLDLDPSLGPEAANVLRQADDVSRL